MTSYLSPQAFLSENFTMTNQGTLGDEFSYAMVINKRGQVVFTFGLLPISLLPGAGLVFELPSGRKKIREP
jgi:uncharacterized membrane protein